MSEEPWASWEPDDPVDIKQRYLRDVGRFALLDAEEEEALACRIEEGRRATAALVAGGLAPQRRRELREYERQGREARDRIVTANLRFVVRLARRQARRGRRHGLELLDLIQEGNLGLLEAAEKFEPGHGKLVTFAKRTVRRRIQRAFEGQGRAVRIPVHAQTKLNRLRRQEAKLLAETGRAPTPEELAAALGIGVDELAEVRGAEIDVISLEQPVPGDGGDELLFGDLVEDPAGEAFARRFVDRRWLAALLGGLDERSRRILEWHFGHELTLEEIGRRENVSRERVRQIERAALEKLRNAGRGSLIDP